mgnify:CR=1 FL=1
MQLTRIFNASVGEKSIGNAGPDAIEQDLDNLYANKAWKDDVLIKTNTTVYTPSQNYHPATKKYVEDYSNDNFMKKITYDADNDGVVDNAKKVNGHTIESNVPLNAAFTDTVTTINDKTGAITKDDIVALGIPAQDTVYNHPTKHNAGMITQTVNAQTGTTYTIAGIDAGNIVTLSNANPITVILPQDSSLEFDVGQKVDFIALGAGAVTFQAGTGATVHKISALTTKGQYSFVTALKIASNTWLLKGDLN